MIEWEVAGSLASFHRNGGRCLIQPHGTQGQGEQEHGAPMARLRREHP